MDRNKTNCKDSWEINKEGKYKSGIPQIRAAKRIQIYIITPIKREEPTATAIAAGDYEKNLSECHELNRCCFHLMILVYVGDMKEL